VPYWNGKTDTEHNGLYNKQQKIDYVILKYPVYQGPMENNN